MKNPLDGLINQLDISKQRNSELKSLKMFACVSEKAEICPTGSVFMFTCRLTKKHGG
jgi:hypothetical protein